MKLEGKQVCRSCDLNVGGTHNVPALTLKKVAWEHLDFCLTMRDACVRLFRCFFKLGFEIICNIYAKDIFHFYSKFRSFLLLSQEQFHIR